jgi:hypothetical protein
MSDKVNELTHAHHPLSPSNYPAFFHCGKYEGSDKSSDSAEKGTACHSLFESLVKARNQRLNQKSYKNKK